MTKLIHALALLIAYTASIPALADVVTIRSVGVIAATAEYSFGEDQLGLFGVRGGSLLGKNFVLTSSFDTENVSNLETFDWYSHAWGLGRFDTSITIEGRTFSYQIDAPVIFNSVIWGALSALGRSDDWLEFQGGGPIEGGFVNVSQYVRTETTPFIGLEPTFNTKAYLTLGPDDQNRAHWGFYTPDGATRFQTFSVTSMEINPSPASVPEPGSVTLSLAGFGFLLVCRRQKTSQLQSGV
jgi:hypothetical protein